MDHALLSIDRQIDGKQKLPTQKLRRL